MKNKRVVLGLLACLMLFGNSYGQEKYGHVTPQTAEFMSYGDIPVSLFAGRMNIEIPLYRIKDRDFDIPISLLYTSDGFKPEKRSDLVGLDWTLIAGGCISREIYGAPDDFRATSTSEEEGFMRVIKNTKFQDRDKIWNMDTSVVVRDTIYGYYLKPVNGYYQDYQPDLFMFNFNGHTGQFMINNKGKGQANCPGYKVDISGLSEQVTVPGWDPGNPASTIRITTPDGYLYEFGGNLNALEYSVSYRENDRQPENPTILAWHLSKITSPNGRSVAFTYVPTTYDIYSPVWQASRGKRETSSVVPIRVSATKKAILESVKVDSVKVEFKKSVETTMGSSLNDKFFQTQSVFNYATYQLDSVIVKYKNQTQYSNVLRYENRDKRRFLTSVIQADSGKYSFQYKHPSSYSYPTNMEPIPRTADIGTERDIYGYWKDNDANSSYGLMEKITYPTGGYSTFTYERHQYRQAAELKLFDLTKLLVTSSNQSKLYGARIKTITSYSSASSAMEMKKEYIYADAVNGTVSSGILYQSPPYYINTSGNKVYVNGNWNKNYNIEESPIGYSTVIEKHQDGSYLSYKFTDYSSNPDDTGNNIKIDLKRKNISSTDSLYIYMGFFSINRVSSNSAKRGLLIEKLVFDSGGVQKSQEQNLYKNVSSGRPITPEEMDLICDCNNPSQPDTSYIVSFRGFVGSGASRKICLKTHPQVLQRIKTDNVVSEEWYRYNYYDQLRSKSIIINPTDTLRTNYIYPTECSDWYCSKLTIQHRLSPVIQQNTYRTSSNASPKEIEQIRTDYVYVSQSDTLLVPNSVQSTRSGSNSWRTDISYNCYDKKGNVLQQTTVDGVPVTFLWGYNYQYPIAEIKGATYADVTGKITEATLKTIAAKDEPTSSDSTTINNLRTQLPNAMVTTYTYKPLVGVTTMTDPRGVVTKYEYDSFGRLNKVTQADRLIEKYDYRYKN